MDALQIIITLTVLVEAGLTVALLYRLFNQEPERTHPNFVVREKKFYRTRKHADGTWEIG